MTLKTPTPLATPTQYAAGYSLDLYCDQTAGYEHDSRFPHTFFGSTFADTSREAKRRGWKIHKATRTATCPKCVKAATA